MDGYANNWDLHAVVRGCSPSYPTFDPTFRDYFPCNFTTNEEDEIGDYSLFFPDLATDANAVQELEEVCRPFVAGSERQVSRPEHHHHRRPSGTPRSKRRKNQQKVVCQVPAEDGHCSDMWAWRKYGQKPIKGSPFPRGYYRCSSSKACSARKQVERNRTDPTTLIITYTGDHNHPVPTHRNSLAGSTRTKFPPPPSSKDDGGQNLDLDLDSDDGTLAKFGLSPTTPLMGATEEDELLMPKDDHEEEEMMNLKDGIEEDAFLNEFLRSMWQNESSAGSSCS